MILALLHMNKHFKNSTGTPKFLRKLPTGALTLRAYCIECGKKDRADWRASSPKDNNRNKAYNKAHADASVESSRSKSRKRH